MTLIADQSHLQSKSVDREAPVGIFKPSEAQVAAAAAQIALLQQEVKYDTRDFTVEHIVKKFQNDELYVPPYQRAFVWPELLRATFVESVILGLPIPMMFFAENDDGRLEIVDGAQRVQTLEGFVSDDLPLRDLKKLTALNKFRFRDLPEAQQRKFQNRPMRVVILESSTTLDARKSIFDRINRRGKKLTGAEARRGAQAGPMMDLVRELAKDAQFSRLCPISESMRMRGEAEELVLRFFAYSDSYLSFKHDVEDFLASYLERVDFVTDGPRLRAEFARTMSFAEGCFGTFARQPGAKLTARVRFEALAVGSNLALRQRPALRCDDIRWILSEEFSHLTRTHASNSGPRLRSRIEFVRDKLLEFGRG